MQNPMSERSPFMLTPWVRRLLMAMAGVYLLQLTIFTSSWLIGTFGFIPERVLRQPWSLVTYAFLHGSPLHILGNALVLFMFGAPVEQRLGSRRFARLFFVSVLGGALLSLAMMPVAGAATIIGASAGCFGVMLAFVVEWPDRPILVFPLPVPVKAKWLVSFMALWSLVAAGFGFGGGVAHAAHLGGFVAGFLYLRGGSLFQRQRAMRPIERAPAVLVRPPASDSARSAYPPPPPRRVRPDAAVREEVDRVLDKISEQGLGSLTPEERRFLDEMSQRFRKDG